MSAVGRLPVEREEQPSVAARCLAVYVVISVARLPELLPFAHSWPLAKVAFAVVLIAAFRGRAGVSAVRLWSIDLARAATFFAALVIATVTYSVWPSHSLSFIVGTFLTIMVGFFVSIKVLARWCDIRVVLKAFAVVGLILAAEALAGYSGGRAAVISSYDTNDLAYVLMGVLPITLAFGVIASGVARICWFGLATIIVTATLLTQSRGGFLALVSVVLMLVWKPLQFRKPDARARAGLWARMLVAVLLSVVAWTQLPASAQHRLGLLITLQQDYNTNLSEKSGRSAIWTRNLIAGVERPIGYGADTFAYVDGTLSGRYMAPHNSVIETFVELGLIGLVLWLRLWILSWRSLTPPPAAAAEDTGTARHHWREKVIFAHGIQISLVALFISGFFLSQAYALILWQIFAVCAATGVLFRTSVGNAAALPRRQHHKGRQQILRRSHRTSIY